MSFVKAKKHLGQHFLRDENIALKIVNSLKDTAKYNDVLEVGPGMGVLTKYLIKSTDYKTFVIDIDGESIEYLKQNYPALENNIIHADFLREDLGKHFSSSFAVIGNFPYNISSQILFKVLEHRDQVPEVVGMFQKEVAVRLASKPGTKDYGILSVLLTAFYNVEYLFTVSPNVFVPPPRVKSAVIRLTRNATAKLDCDEVKFFDVVKTAFNQRRKTLRNALSKFNISDEVKQHPFMTLRAEVLSVKDFVELTNMLNNGSISSKV